jgi:hypothetical protein
VIAGATRGSGGRSLARHLTSVSNNDQVIAGPSRGLVSDPEDAYTQLRELESLQSHVRTARPLHHVHADPPEGLAPEHEAAVRAAFWQHYEQEFSLQGQPFFSRIHVKNGRVHEHRVIGLGRSDGSVIDLSHDHARREKVSRIVEHTMGLPFVKGAHNKAVVAALMRENKPEIADAMKAAGLLDGSRPRAQTTPGERAQQERAGIPAADVRAAALSAWRASDNGHAFAAALVSNGLRLAQGDRVPVVIDQGSHAHPLARVLAQAARESGSDPIRAAAVAARIAGLDLARHVPTDKGRKPVLNSGVEQRGRAAGSAASAAEPGSLAALLATAPSEAGAPASSEAPKESSSAVTPGPILAEAAIPAAAPLTAARAAEGEIRGYPNRPVAAETPPGAPQEKVVSLYGPVLPPGRRSLSEREAPLPSCPQPQPEEAMMAAPANKPVRRPTVTPARVTPPAALLPWMQASGGWESMPPDLQASARRSHKEWLASHPNREFGLAAYIGYVQQREAERQTAGAPGAPGKRSAGAPAAQQPATPLRPVDRLKATYDADQQAHQDAQALAKKAVADHANTAHAAALDRAWDRYKSARGRYQSAQGLMAALVAGIVMKRLENKYIAERRAGDIEKMITTARANTAPAPFKSGDEWMADRARAGDPDAQKAVKAKAAKREREIAALAATDPAAAARARLDDAQAKIDRVLSGRPDPGIDAREIATDLEDGARGHAAAAAEKATDARRAAEDQWAEKGSISGRLFGGPAWREQQVMRVLAERAEAQAKVLNGTLPARLEDCAIAANGIAREAKQTVASWEKRPEVVEAKAEQERINALSQALDAGDPATTAALKDGQMSAALAAATSQRLRSGQAADPAPDSSVPDAKRGYGL